MTAIGADPAQVEYRLGAGHGCTSEAVAEARFSYHVDGRERPLRWIGKGLAAFGIDIGSELTPGRFDAARTLMTGCDPLTGERLVEPKLAVRADAKLPLAALVEAVDLAAAARGIEAVEFFPAPRDAASWGRAVRAVARSGEAARLRADAAGHLAEVAGVDPAAVWGAEAYGAAVWRLTETVTVTNADGMAETGVRPRRQVVGNLGYDISFTLPKSHSLLLAFADEPTAHRIEALYDGAVSDTFTWLESATCYGMRGKHGDGRTAEVVAGEGFAGWSMTHRAARPVGDATVGDPHWHVHVTVANLTRGADGKWSTVAAGGRDLMRHAPAADHVLKALVRHRLTTEFGVRFARSERTGAWEVAAIPDEVLRVFSKRGASIAALLADLGLDPGCREAGRIAEAQTRQAKSHATAAPDATLREQWQAEARALGVDPDQLAATALPGPATDPPPVGEAEVLAGIVARLLDPESGLTSTGRRFTRVEAMAAVADALPNGAADVAEIERFTDAALAHPGFVPLGTQPETADLGAAPVPPGARRQLAAAHMANAGRWTTADVVAAEAVILTATAGSRSGVGGVRVDPGTAGMAVGTVEAGLGHPLSGEQVAAVLRLVGDDRPIDAVLGPPGTGKTTLLAAARAAWETAGYRVAGAATAAVAAANLQAESGIESGTVAQWLHRIGHADGLAGIDVLVLDEANLTDDRARARLYVEAARTATKVVEVGDPKQLRGVGCGSLFGRVHELLDGPVLTENRRQRDLDERAAVASWRAGRYTEALSSWATRERLVATETTGEAVAAMVGTWMTERAGAPDGHEAIAGLVMLADTNEAVERLNDATQALRAATGELGPHRDYRLPGGRDLRVHQGDQVLIRLNDRNQRMHSGPDVLNGYRGLVEAIHPDGRLDVAWRRQGPDGQRIHRATLDPAYVAAGGLSLGYAMTVHKAEGLTVAADWARPDGTRTAGAVLVHAAGMDAPALHVATTRHRDRMILFAAREQVEDHRALWEDGLPAPGSEVTGRVVAALAEHAEATTASSDDVPVHHDLRHASAVEPTPAQPAPSTPTPEQGRPAAEPQPRGPAPNRTWRAPPTRGGPGAGTDAARRGGPPRTPPPTPGARTPRL